MKNMYTCKYDVSPTKESGRKKMPVILISSLSKNNTSDKKLLCILKNSRNPSVECFNGNSMSNILDPPSILLHFIIYNDHKIT